MRGARPPLPNAAELAIESLGPCRYPSPIARERGTFVDESIRVLSFGDTASLEPFLEHGTPPPAFERAGPRPMMFFDPAELTCGILTCGGLCPGMNDVVRSVVLCLRYAYGVRCLLHVPIALAVAQRRQLDPRGEAWQRVLEATGQPVSMVGR